ncbi:MAG: hypothetical protein WAJ99_15025 [Candidatus Sulfotelmatobacter sp.]
MKDIALYAIDRNWNPQVDTLGLEASVVETDGDFELVDPLKNMSGEQYVKGRSVTVVFDDLHELVESLESFQGFSADGFQGAIEKHGVKLLLMIVHGAPGALFVEGNNRPEFLAPLTFMNYADDLDRLGKFLATNATVRFDGCNAGSDVNGPLQARGSELLIALSKIWSGVRVVGFTDYGSGHETIGDRRVWAATDTNVYFPAPEPDNSGFFRRVWSNLWEKNRSENSPNAKIAQDGAIIKTPASEVLCPKDDVLLFVDGRGTNHTHCMAKTSAFSPDGGAASPPGTTGGAH